MGGNGLDVTRRGMVTSSRLAPIRMVLRALPFTLALAGCVSAQTRAAAHGTLSSIDLGHSRVATASDCSSLAQAIVSSHPRLVAARLRAQAALADADAMASLPAPRASIEVWDFPIGDPSQAGHDGMYMVGVAQELTPSGAREGRANARAHDALAEIAAGRDAARLLRAEVEHVCIDWASAEALRAPLEAHRALVEQQVEAMTAGYRAEGSVLGDLARLDAELAAAERHVAEADEEALTARAIVEALAVDVRVPDAPPVLEPASAFDDRSEGRTGNRPDVQAARERTRAAAAMQEAAEAEASTPIFEVRATYMQTPSMRAGAGAMVSMTLPWFWGGGSEASEGARFETQAAASEIHDLERTARVEVARATGRVRTLARTLTVLRQRELPAAQRLLEAERAGISAGAFSLVRWLEATHLLRQARLDEARTVALLAHAWADLELAAGRSQGQVDD